MDDENALDWVMKSRADDSLKQNSKHIREWIKFCKNENRDWLFTDQISVTRFCANVAKDYSYSVVTQQGVRWQLSLY